MDDNFDELLADIDEPSSAKQQRLDDNVPSTSKNENNPEIIQPKTSSTSIHSVLVNPKQKGNLLLKGITSVPWEFDDILPDYVMGPTTCALFLTIKYHNMNPDYIHERLRILGKSYDLRILLVQVDLPDPYVALKNLTRICLLADLTLMLAWSPDEAGKIIETYKIYENKPPDRIMEKIENDPHQKLVNAITSIKPVNKTDAMTLITVFETLENIVKTPEIKLSNCPGFGKHKASKLFKVLHEPFLKGSNKNNTNDVASTSTAFNDELNVEEIESLLENN